MNELINLDALGDVGTALLDKLDKAVGWIVNRDTPKRQASTVYIDEIRKSNLPALQKAAIISNAGKIIKEYVNQSEILSIAIQHMNSEASPQDISDDWLAYYMDKIRLVSEKEFQYIWGKILAEECNEPGSIPKGLLAVLEKMDKADAECFMLCYRSSVKIGNSYFPLIFQMNKEKHPFTRDGVDNLLMLSSLGLIDQCIDSISNGFLTEPDETPVVVRYYEHSYCFPENIKKISVGHVLYTRLGEALAKAIEDEEIEGYWDEFCKPFCERIEKNNKE